MPPLSVVVLTINIAVVFCIQLRGPYFDVRTNKTEDANDSFKCNGWQQTFGSLKGKENVWIANMKEHLDHVNFYTDILKREREELSNITKELKFTDKKIYLGNPFSLFALLKRSAKVWPKIALLMYSLPGGLNSVGHSTSFVRLYKGYKDHLPDIEDLSTGYRGLSRLQQVYHLNTDSIADQMEASQESLFSVNDFLGFAKYFCTKAMGEKCQEWLEKVQNKNTNISAEDFHEFSFLSNCLNGNQAGANNNFRELLERKSTFTSLSEKHELLQFNLEEVFFHGCEEVKKNLEGLRQKTSKTLIQHTDSENERFIAWTNVYDHDPGLLDLCRSPAVYNVTARLLKCRYIHYHKPQLMIGPFKMEEFHIDPPILMFHDIIYDQEISEMMNFIRRKLRKARVRFPDGSNQVDVNFRTNSQAWVKNKVPLAKTLNERVARLSGMDTRSSESIHVACYGPGGEFNPHIDALDEESAALSPLYGDYSVVMFYISDVEEGGHTIFPALNVSLVPRKGSAALWFNRKPDGTVDQESLHGGCPVLEGFKWVINKWVHKVPQDYPKCTNKINSSFRYFYL